MGTSFDAWWAENSLSGGAILQAEARRAWNAQQLEIDELNRENRMLVRRIHMIVSHLTSYATSIKDLTP